MSSVIYELYLTFSMLASFMLKYPLHCALLEQQPLIIEPCFNFSTTLSVANESLQHQNAPKLKQQLIYDFLFLADYCHLWYAKG